MKNLINQNMWYWDDIKFFNRSYIIKVNIFDSFGKGLSKDLICLLKEHYQKFLDGEEEILYIAKEDDP
jgi:hypothetical protein